MPGDGIVVDVAPLSDGRSLTVTNPTSQPRAAVIAIDLGERLPITELQDRSLGSWVYGRRDLLIDTAGDLEPVPDVDVISTHRVVDTVRHRIRGIASDLPGTFDSEGQVLTIETPSIGPGEAMTFALRTYDGQASEAELRGTEFDDALYFSVLPGIRALTFLIERFLVLLAGVGPVFAIVALAICVRVVTFPINRWAAQRQRLFSAASAKMDPLIKAAKADLKGAAQSERILEIYKQHGVNPFSGLAGSIGLFLQIPVLLCVFNVMAESSAFSGVGWWLLQDLSQPDRAVSLGANVPLLGGYLNVLPLILGLSLWASVKLGKLDDQASTGVTGMVLSFAMVVFFFSFASGLVIYWIVVSLLRIPEQWLFGEKEPANATT